MKGRFFVSFWDLPPYPCQKHIASLYNDKTIHNDSQVNDKRIHSEQLLQRQIQCRNFTGPRSRLRTCMFRKTGQGVRGQRLLQGLANALQQIIMHRSP
jgi:hypothetical protein